MSDQHIQQLIREISQGSVQAAVALATAYERNGCFARKFYLLRSVPVFINAYCRSELPVTSPNGTFLIKKIYVNTNSGCRANVVDPINGRWFSSEIEDKILEKIVFEPPFVIPPNTGLVVHLEDSEYTSQSVNVVFSGELIGEKQ